MPSNFLRDDMDLTRGYDTLAIICMAGCFISPVCLFVHLFKFFNARTAQNLPSKNLASYCVCSLFMYTCMISYSCFTGIFGHERLLTLKEYLHVTSSLLLLNMSLDTLICMRKSVKNFRLSKGSRLNVFIVYTIFAWGFSALVTAALYFTINSAEERVKFNVTVAITMLIRLLCFGLFCLSVFYIKSADITNTNLKSYVFMHARLLLINGVSSVLWYVTVAMMFFFDTWNEWFRVTLFISVVLYAYDGVFIALFYTFKEGMFEVKGKRNLKNIDCNQICVIGRDDMISSPATATSNVRFDFDSIPENSKNWSPGVEVLSVVETK